MGNNMAIWSKLDTLDQKYEGVDDQSDTDAARILWDERLQVMHNNDGRRLKQLAAGHGFYITIDDYPLPGKIFSLLLIS
jgi:hypothetical protein